MNNSTLALAAKVFDAMKTAHFFRSRDGRLSEHWGIRDELDVLYQVGTLTPPDMSEASPVPD